MTGIERLHKLIADIDVSADPELWYILRGGTEVDWDCEKNDNKTLGSTLAAIADQIEREQGGRVSRMRVLAVVTDMERHCLGHEGMEDSPVARWARELREALGGDRRDRAADVSVSAYDLLPQEERDAIAWVREHGGLEEVEAHWSGRVPLTSVKRMVALHKAKRERLKAHALGLERKCAERGETIRELSGKAAKQSNEIRVMRVVIVETCARLGVEGTGSTVDDAQVIWREISRRLMPEGMEWPRYDSGEQVRIGETMFSERDGKPHKIARIAMMNSTYLMQDMLGDTIYQGVHGIQVKRPAPKVLDADGVDISVGDTVYEVDTGEKMWVCALPEQGAYQCVKLRLINGMFKTLDPCRLTHRAPVLAADGEPLEVGQTVWETDAETDTPLTVVEVSSDLVGCEYTWKDGKTYRPCCPPDQLTHTKPEPPDSWERIEEDATKNPFDYCKDVGHRLDTCENSEAYKARDIVRRAKALAERGA